MDSIDNIPQIVGPSGMGFGTSENHIYEYWTYSFGKRFKKEVDAIPEMYQIYLNKMNSFYCEMGDNSLFVWRSKPDIRITPLMEDNSLNEYSIAWRGVFIPPEEAGTVLSYLKKEVA